MLIKSPDAEKIVSVEERIMRPIGKLLLALPAFLICGIAKSAQDDIIVNGQRPVLTAGGWRVDEGLWRAGGWQSRHGERTRYYCVGREDIDKLLLVMMGGKDSERPPQCDKVKVDLRKGKIIAKWRCLDGDMTDMTLTAPYNPELIDATIESIEHGVGSHDKGNYTFMRHSKAQYVAACPQG